MTETSREQRALGIVLSVLREVVRHASVGTAYTDDANRKRGRLLAKLTEAQKLLAVPETKEERT